MAPLRYPARSPAAARCGDRERGQNPSLRSGQALLEFALVLPAVIVLMIGGYNFGLLFLRLTDAGFIAQSAATAAARYGGDTDALHRSVEAQLAQSFIGGDRRHFRWWVETRAADGAPLCVPPEPEPELPPDAGQSPAAASGSVCTCNWGEQAVVVARYEWVLDAGLYAWRGVWAAEKAALCWRGTVPGGPEPDGAR